MFICNSHKTEGLTNKLGRVCVMIIEVCVCLTDKLCYLLLILHTLLFLARFPVESVNSSLVELLSRGTWDRRKCGHFLVSQSGGD